jgi:hypothetical protein
MKTAGHLTWLVILLTAASFVQAENIPVAHLNIVPLPVKVKPLPGTFMLNNQSRIVAVDEESAGGPRRRQPAHDDSHSPGQGPPRSRCSLEPQAAGDPARLLALDEA